jgi:hypothetical protein
MAKEIKTFDEFKSELMSSPKLQNQFKEDPVSAVQDFQQSNPLSTDKWIYRIIVLALGVTILTIIVGVIILIGSGRISDDKGVPTILTAIGSAAIGALAGLLAPPPKTN